jgi:DNA-binding LacI/PurR family transcriptional regulator
VSRRPSIRDVAHAAGVSTGLASLALNDRAGVAATTRARIREVADELGYRADPHARALRTGQTDTVALIVRNLINPYFLEVISAAQQSAAEHGISVLVVDSNYDVAREREHIERLAAQRVGALAIAPVGAGSAIERWRELAPDRPTVVLNATATGFDDVDRVSPDNETAVALATTHLAELGHRRISFLTAPADLMADHDRLEAFLRVCDELDVEPDPVETALNQPAVRETTERLLARKTRPTAIVTNSDFSAQAVYLGARSAGVAIGGQLSVVGHDDLPTSELLDPPLTTLSLDRRAIGRALAARLRRSATGDHREPVELVVRASTGHVSA